jgi:putative membrane protein
MTDHSQAPLQQASRFTQAQFQALKPEIAELMAQQPLNAAERFDHSVFVELTPTEPVPSKSSNRGLWYWVGALCSLTLLASWQWLTFISESWQSSVWQGGAVSALTGFILLLAGRAGWAEWRLWRQLRQRQEWRQTSARLVQSVQFGEAMPLCQQIRSAMPSSVATETRWQQFISQHRAEHSDAETLRLFEMNLLQAADLPVQQQIRQAAMQTGVAVAMSPFALADMLLVLWRGSLMLREIAHLYGCSLGRLRTLRLMKKFVQTVFFAGASEMAVDLGSDLLGAELTGKLSARLGQGVLAAVLVARLGRFAQQELRPLPQASMEPTLIAQVVQDVLQKLKPAPNAN